jgi:hypothetical protein
VFVLGKKTQCLAPSHQFASGREDNRDAEVFGVALDFNAEEFGSGGIFSTQWKYTEQRASLAIILGNYLRVSLSYVVSVTLLAVLLLDCLVKLVCKRHGNGW